MGSNNAYRSLSIKAVKISAPVLSTAVILYLAGPCIVRFALSEIPKLYDSAIAWLTPPYLYFVINGIIISIAASSRFHSGSDSESDKVDLIGSGPSPVLVADPAPVKVVEYAVPAVYEKAEMEEAKVEEKEEEEEEFVISRLSWEPRNKRTESLTAAVTEIPTLTETFMAMEKEIPTVTEYSFLNEKPLVSSRLGRRKSLKASPEASKVLKIARPKKNGTLESTWKAITDGRNVPLTRHLKKSDTWETLRRTCAARDNDDDDDENVPPPDPIMRKSETFNEHRKKPAGRKMPTSAGSPSAARLRKVPSLGQDDLNRRVEAFINKFNEEMRLQGQESFKRTTWTDDQISN